MIKKILLVATSLTLTYSTLVGQTRKGEFSFSPSISYLSKVDMLGLGARLYYGLTDKIRLEGVGNYYLPKSTGHGDSKEYAIDASINAQYLLQIGTPLTLYPLAGIGYFYNGVSSNYLNVKGSGNLMFNLGAGGVFRISPNFGIGGELKYLFIKGGNTPSLSTSLYIGI